MEAAGPTALTLVPAVASAALAAERPVRLPEEVYRRRRLAVAAVGVAVLTLALALGRPDRVPLGEANPWPSTADVSLPAELPGVYVVQPGDTLWGLALAMAPGEDPRALVHDLAEAAGGAALVPGQRIVLDAAVGISITGTADNHSGDGLGRLDGTDASRADGLGPVAAGAVGVAQAAGASGQRQARHAGQGVASAPVDVER